MRPRLWFAVAIAVILVGCRRLDADASSDGKTVAIASGSGLRIRSTVGRDLDVVIGGGEATGPRWSHGDNRVAYFDAKGRLCVYSLPDRRRTISAWKGMRPIAWSTDDKRLAFVQKVDERHVVRVVDAKTDSALALEPLGADDVTNLRFTPDGKRLMATTQSSIQLVGGSQTCQFVFEGAVVGSALRADGHPLALVTASADDPVPKLDLIDCDPVAQTQTVTAKNLLAGRLGRDVVEDGAIEPGDLSPDGSRLACLALVDRSPEHALRRLMSKSEKMSDAERDALEAKAQLEAWVYVFDVRGGGAPLTLDLPKFDPKKINGTLLWSADGKTLAIVAPDYGRLWQP